MLNDIKTFINDNQDEYIKLQSILTSHIALAPENGGDGELEKCIALTNFLKEHGITDLERIDVPDERVSSKIRPNLIATIEGEEDDYSIWIISHLDVVPAGDLDLWDSDPWKLTQKDGKLFGRGVEDNQQGIVSSFAAAWAYVSLGIKPKHTLKLLFVADEEVGSHYGMFWLLDNTDLFKKEDLILIPDGGDPLGETIEIAEKSVLWFEFNTIGEQCHGANPKAGNNACLAANHLAVRLNKELYAHFDKINPLFSPNISTFEPTMRKSNVDGINIIPGKDTSYMDCRILPDYSVEEVLDVVNSICSSIEEEFNVKIQYKLPQRAESLPTSKDAKVVKLLSESLKETRGIDSKLIGIGGGTVASEFRNQGYEAVVWSSLDDTAHTPNEYCLIDNIIKDAVTIAVLISK